MLREVRRLRKSMTLRRRGPVRKFDTPPQSQVSAGLAQLCTRYNRQARLGESFAIDNKNVKNSYIEFGDFYCRLL